jgi:molecular chaperone DnaK
LKDNAPVEQIRSLKDDLQQAAYSLSEAAYKKTQTTGGPSGGTGESYGSAPGSASPGTHQTGPDVVDAEYEVK